jgi:hypothetical protein
MWVAGFAKTLWNVFVSLFGARILPCNWQSAGQIKQATITNFVLFDHTGKDVEDM